MILPVTASFAILAATGYALGVRLNMTGSIPPGLYKQSRGPIVRGAIVLACLPPNAAAFARARGYVPGGSCGDGSAPVGKLVAAVPGDTVAVTAAGIDVNGRHLQNTAPLRTDAKNRPLPAVRVDDYVVPAGELWLASTYSARSFDSRYFGGIPLTAVVARVRPLFTW